MPPDAPTPPKTGSQENSWSEETSRTFIQYGRYFVPEREAQLQAMVALIPFLDRPQVIIDLCCGEGFLSEAILQKHPTCQVIGLDGSIEMLRLAEARSVRFGKRFQALPFDLFQRTWPESELPIRAVVSSLAIHHLDGEQKQELFQEIAQALAPEGALIVADVIAPAHRQGWELAADAWDEAVRQRALHLDGNLAAYEFFAGAHWNMYRYFDPLDIDRPSRLFDQLKWLEQAGFTEIDVHWMRAGHAIFSGYKPG